MKRKITALIMAAFLCTVCMTACSQPDSSAETFSEKSAVEASVSTDSDDADENLAAFVFTPLTDYVAENELTLAQDIIERRIKSKGITKYEIETDYKNNQINVRFTKWSDEDFGDKNDVVMDIAEKKELVFRLGDEASGEEILTGENIVDATNKPLSDKADDTNEYVVEVEMDKKGKEAFAKATEENVGKTISVWLDDKLIANPTVVDAITDGKAFISGNFTEEEAQKLADDINSGTLPFELKVKDE